MFGRSIVSPFGHLTKKTSDIIDLHLRPNVDVLPTYLKNNKCYRNNHLPLAYQIMLLLYYMYSSWP